MKKYFSFKSEDFKSLLGKNISSIHFVEDFRLPIGNLASFNPYNNRFEGIQNLVIWGWDYEKHYCESIKLYCIDNGRFATKSDNNEEVLSYYGIRSIVADKNNDLRFGKSGSIRLKPPSGFSINMNIVVERIYFYQEISKNLISEQPKEIIPKFKVEGLFPDRIVLESDEMFILIRAYEDYDQDYFITLNLGYKNKVDFDYKIGSTESDSCECILIDEISKE